MTEGPSLHHAAAAGTYAEFVAAYRPADATGPAGQDLLISGLAHPEPAARLAIASRLLDDGADPTGIDEYGVTTLHALVGQGEHDFEAEAPLLQRLLEGGADVNVVHRKFGTPLEAVAAAFQFSEVDLAPFYDVLLAQAELDPLMKSVYKNTVLANIRNWERPVLVQRLEKLLRERGVEVPPADPS